MSVYVDALREWGWKYGASSHLYADTLEELHAFAARLGLKRAWFQDGKRPHYDLTAAKRTMAIRLGAIFETDQHMIEHFRRCQE